MHHPESPEVIDDETFARARQQPYGIERRNGKGGIKQQPRHIAEVVLAQSSAETAKQNEHPKEKTHNEQDLPEPAKVEVFPALMAEPKPQSLAQLAARSQIFPC